MHYSWRQFFRILNLQVYDSAPSEAIIEHGVLEQYPLFQWVFEHPLKRATSAFISLL